MLMVTYTCSNGTELYENDDDDDDDDSDGDDDDDTERNDSGRGKKVRRLPQAIIIGAKKAGTCKLLLL